MTVADTLAALGRVSVQHQSDGRLGRRSWAAQPPEIPEPRRQLAVESDAPEEWDWSGESGDLGAMVARRVWHPSEPPLGSRDRYKGRDQGPVAVVGHPAGPSVGTRT